jgi:hypothetical protein
MSLFAYAVRRAVGAVVVFLIVVLLTMFAVASIGPFDWETGPARLIRVNEVRMDMADAWASFPAQAVGAFGLVVVAAVAWRLAARCR